MTIHAEILAYNAELSPADRAIAEVLSETMEASLKGSENKVWHRHPVWFLDGNPVAGYSKLKGCVRLLFWSGQSFDEPDLHPEGTFKAAEARYTSVEDVDLKALKRWLKKSRTIQWDYKNIVRKKGVLDRIS